MTARTRREGLAEAAACGGGSQHLATARGVHGEHADAQLGGLADGCGDGGGDVVILEVEEDLPAGADEIADYLRAFGGIELHPDFVAEGGIAHGRHDLVGGGRGRYIQSNDQTLTRIVHL